MMKKKYLALSVILLLALFLNPMAQPQLTEAKSSQRPQQQQVTAYDLISAMNVLRMSIGNNGLIMDDTINAVAQTTAQIMADQNLSWHIGNVGGAEYKLLVMVPGREFCHRELCDGHQSFD